MNHLPEKWNELPGTGFGVMSKLEWDALLKLCKEGKATKAETFGALERLMRMHGDELVRQKNGAEVVYQSAMNSQDPRTREAAQQALEGASEALVRSEAFRDVLRHVLGAVRLSERIGVDDWILGSPDDKP
jgi:hypothetical protein